LEQVTAHPSLLAQLVDLDAMIWARTANDPSTFDLADIVWEARKSGPAQVAVETVLVEEGNPLDWVGPRAAGIVETRSLNGMTFRLILDKYGPFVLGAVPTRHEGIFHLIGSVPTTDPRWRKVERWIGRASPAVAPCFLDHSEFAAIGTALEDLGCVEVSRITARRLGDQSSLNRGWKERDGSPRPSPAEAIGEAEREGASVRTMTLRVAGHISVHVRRVAGATFYTGDFEAFRDLVLDRLAAAAARRRRLLVGRKRTPASPPPRPIRIRLNEPTMVDAAATGLLIAALENSPRTAVAVLHRNPYLHLIVTDYDDGSNFDVFVTKDDEIEVHAGFRSSMGSLARLTQTIGDQFAGNEISESHQDASVSLADLVGG
jgi:hypothetical protein